MWAHFYLSSRLHCVKKKTQQKLTHMTIIVCWRWWEGWTELEISHIRESSWEDTLRKCSAEEDPGLWVHSMWSLGYGVMEGRIERVQLKKLGWGQGAPETNFPNRSFLPGIGLRLACWFQIGSSFGTHSKDQWHTSLTLGNSQCVIFAGKFA